MQRFQFQTTRDILELKNGTQSPKPRWGQKSAQQHTNVTKLNKEAGAQSVYHFTVILQMVFNHVIGWPSWCTKQEQIIAHALHIIRAKFPAKDCYLLCPVHQHGGDDIRRNHLYLHVFVTKSCTIGPCTTHGVTGQSVLWKSRRFKTSIAGFCQASELHTFFFSVMTSTRKFSRFVLDFQLVQNANYHVLLRWESVNMQSYHLVTWPMEHDVTIMMRTAAFVSTANVRCVCPTNRDVTTGDVFEQWTETGREHFACQDSFYRVKRYLTLKLWQWKDKLNRKQLTSGCCPRLKNVAYLTILMIHIYPHY